MLAVQMSLSANAVVDDMTNWVRLSTFAPILDGSPLLADVLYAITMCFKYSVLPI